MKQMLGVLQMASGSPWGCLGFLPAWRSGAEQHLTWQLASTQWGRGFPRCAKQKEHISYGPASQVSIYFHKVGMSFHSE